MFRLIPRQPIIRHVLHSVKLSQRTLVHTKEIKTQLQREKDKQKKRKLRQELKFKSLENPIEHPLHMPIAEALNTIRSFEVGKPVDKTTITCHLYVRQEQGAHPINGTVDIPYPVNKKTKPLIFTTQQSMISEIEPLVGSENIGGKELIDKFINQELLPSDFTHVFATSEMESQLRSVARILGPAGLQPTKKKGTVTDDPHSITNILRSFQIKQKDSNITFSVGNCTFSDFQIMSNLKAVSDVIFSQIDPNASKKTRLGYCYITTANSPGLVIDFKQE
ncbi:hypothetical protein KGF54_000832 [Candida jiufengensis]|uniref:uncharacterized protein n=1 Tax=Candida jiufengensis TaxID=497108 RepID=UPI002224B676|nr:uncharacterized protein KGF54_000832 [Candida jiufengensis]KAI5956357.1 hypothetical protein KGF54_000832 [Candida jiufengensis]